MAATLVWQETGGTTASPIDFGLVPEGTVSSTVQKVLKNTGDAAALNVQARVTQTSTLDGECVVTVGGEALTGTYAVVSASLAAGASLTFDVYWSTPADATWDA
jgi:hypothetical protein